MDVVLNEGDLMYKPKAKLQIETNDETDVALQWLIENETPLESGEPLNKTTIINRAVQVYAVLRRELQAGRVIYVGDTSAPDGLELSVMRFE
jgi:hypothetical protein